MAEAITSREQIIAELGAPDSAYAVGMEMIRGIEYPVFTRAPESLRTLYADSQSDEATPFLVYGDESLSFAEVHRRAATLSRRLHDRFGIGPGDRVAIAMRNYPEWCLAFMAVTAIGAIAVTLNAWWTGRELEYGLRDSGSRLLFADPERIERLRSVLADLDLEAITVRAASEPPPGVHVFEQVLLPVESVDFPAAEIDRDDDAVIMYTSGSTGHPKGVISTHRGILSALLGWEFGGRLALRLAGRTAPVAPEFPPAMLLSVPLFHVSGSHVQFLMSFRLRRKLVMMYRWDPEEALALIERERITEFNGVPTMSADLLNSPDFDRRDLRSLKGVGGGGAARPPEQVRRIRDRVKGGVPGTGYGLTETNAIATTIGGRDYLERPDSVGRPSPPLISIRIIDDAGRTRPTGEHGEILIKGCVNMRGYWNAPDATAAVLRDGWLHTGDIGRLDDEGFLYITDRAKDIVIRGGENISCLEVEGVIYDHPAVLEAAAFGVPDPRLGEALAAVVVVRPGHDLEADELRQHVARQLAGFKVPSRLWFRREKLPRIASGKLAKRQLRDDAIASLG